MGYIVGNLRRSDIVECEFGNFAVQRDPQGKPIRDAQGQTIVDSTNMDHRIPHEMVKKRPVVVLGDHRGLYVVVPISSTEEVLPDPDKSGVGRGLHVPIPPGEMPNTHRYGVAKPRWAKANLVQAVDKKRLSTAYCDTRKAHAPGKVTPETLQAIQFAVARAIGLGAMVNAAAGAGAPPQAPPASAAAAVTSANRK